MSQREDTVSLPPGVLYGMYTQYGAVLTKEKGPQLPAGPPNW